MKNIFIRKYKKKSKKSKKHKNSINKKRYSRKYRKTMKNVAKGGPYNCCMCGTDFESVLPLSPSACVKKNKEKSHKICQECWWGKFAVEGVSHNCPGCPPEPKKRPVIIEPMRKSGTPEIIDLVSSND